MRQHHARTLAVTLVGAWMAVSGTVAVADPLPGGLSPDGPPPAVHVGALAADGTLFWNGNDVGSDPVHRVPLAPAIAAVNRCSIQAACEAFTFDVTAAAPVLRVGLDTPSRDDTFDIAVVDPTGRATRMSNPNNYSVEAKLGNPVPGLWTMTVAPVSAEEAPYRLRAKLEATPHVRQASADGYYLPNLQVTRMWEFGFVAPANPGNGLFPPDDANPPLSVGGIAPVSCAADETVENGSSRCLRYSFGLANTGDGVFDIRWSSTAIAAGSHPMFQCVQKATGGTESRPAGTGSFHKTHGHWHYDDVVHHEVFEVSAPGVMQSTGTGKKLGYSPADQAIIEWDRFVQANAGSSGQAGNCVEGANQRLGMSAGWGDAYRYQRPGNYVEFGTNGDGEYVVQTIADPLDRIRETNEADNISYAHVIVTGADVDVREVGRGTSPWDPNKTVIEDWWTQ